MNQTLQALADRKSVRAYLDRPISAEDKSAILRAAAEAPTAGCQQLYTILDITDQELKAKLAESCDRQPFIAKAPLVLIFCADCQKWYDGYLLAGCEPRRPGEGDLLLAVNDALIAAQNAVTAAWSLGIGSCYIGDVMEQAERHREWLRLPDYVFPAAMLVFGYPTQQQLERKKPERCEMDLIVNENGYRRLSESDLRRMVLYKCGKQSFAEWMRAFCDRKYNSRFSNEMTRSVRRYLDAFSSQGERSPRSERDGSPAAPNRT